MITSHQFKAFDTEIVLCAITQSRSLKNILGKIEKNAYDFEKRFSRFETSSELNKINHKSNVEIKVSTEMLEVLLKAKNAYRITKGIFDPTIHQTLFRIGYDKTFDSLRNTPKGSNLKIDKYADDDINKKKPSFKKFIINEKNKTITSPLGLKIDFGGIAKGYWVDKMKDLLGKYCDNYWIGAGGDIFMKGKNEKNEPWEVTIQNPAEMDANILSLHIPKGEYGIATSGITKRQGIKNGKKWNHIIDPRTNIQVKNSILSVTVIAKTTTDADIMAKTVLILGIKNGLAFLRSMKNHECVIIDKNLQMHISDGIKEFL